METYYRYIYKVKPGSRFMFVNDDEHLTEATVITTNEDKALRILENNYPHFRKNEVYLCNSYEESSLFK